MNRFTVSLTFMFFLISLLKGVAQDENSYVLLHDSVETSNGIQLATDIYLPDNDHTFPVILVRTPYKKEHFKYDATLFTKQGYAVVVQDCRGKFGSGGDFYPFVNERIDGLKTVDWIKKQSWCKDKIAGYGGSYVGYTQWAIADQLDAICPDLTGANIYDLLYPQGLFSLSLAFNWGMAVDSHKENAIDPDKKAKSFWYLPLSVADDSTYHDSQFINDWILHEQENQYWKDFNHRKFAKGPVLSIAGWYDIFLLAQISDFVEIDRHNNHPGNKMVIGPWCHGSQSYKNGYGGADKVGNTASLKERFLSKNLLGKEVEVMETPYTDSKYNLFIMERNTYYGSETWPPKEVEKVDLFLDVNKITERKPEKENRLHYIYDPMKPYPNLGGSFLGSDVGPAIQNPNSDRCDQWVFESDILTDPVTLLGSISASLLVSSNVETTDFIILVQDLFPNDTIINIQEGGKRVRLEKDKVNRIEIESWPTGYQLNPGHKLRIAITSSWFPRYNRSLNSEEPVYHAVESEQAIHTIYLGGEYPSKITLPLLNPGKR